jgi:hypothetical protein
MDHDTKSDNLAVQPDSDSADFLAGYINEQAYAARRGVSVRTCQRDRRLRQAPPYIQLGKRIYYRVDALRDWLIRRERADAPKPTAPRAGARHTTFLSSPLVRYQ